MEWSANVEYYCRVANMRDMEGNGLNRSRSSWIIVVAAVMCGAYLFQHFTPRVRNTL